MINSSAEASFRAAMLEVMAKQNPEILEQIQARAKWYQENVFLSGLNVLDSWGTALSQIEFEVLSFEAKR